MGFDKSLYISNRLREVLLNGRWIANTNYQEHLLQLDWKQASQKYAGIHSIAELVFHIHYYMGGLIQVLHGGSLEIHDKFSFDAPEITSESEWQDRIKIFIRDSEIFCDLVSQLSEARWEEYFVLEKYGSYLRNIDGFIEHAYYHLGQIGLIRKMLLNA